MFEGFIKTIHDYIHVLSLGCQTKENFGMMTVGLSSMFCLLPPVQIQFEYFCNMIAAALTADGPLSHFNDMRRDQIVVQNTNNQMLFL